MSFLHVCLELGLPCPLQPHPAVGVREAVCVGAGVLPASLLLCGCVWEPLLVLIFKYLALMACNIRRAATGI